MFKDKINLSLRLEVNSEEMEAIDLVVDTGVRSAASHLGTSANSDSWMPFIAIGDGVTEPSSTDESLESELHRKRGTVTVENNTYFVEADFAVDEPTDDCIVREIGIFDAISGGNMGARWLLVEDVIKEYDRGINVRCAITLT